MSREPRTSTMRGRGHLTQQKLSGQRAHHPFAEMADRFRAQTLNLEFLPSLHRLFSFWFIHEQVHNLNLFSVHRRHAAHALKISCRTSNTRSPLCSGVVSDAMRCGAMRCSWHTANGGAHGKIFENNRGEIFGGFRFIRIQLFDRLNLT